MHARWATHQPYHVAGGNTNIVEVYELIDQCSASDHFIK